MLFNYIPITINVSEVYRYLGFRKQKTENNEQIEALIEQCIKASKKFLEAKGFYKKLIITDKMERDKKIICDEGILIIEGEKIYEHLKESNSIYVLAATIGEQISQVIDDKFAQGQITEATIYDAIGSDAVERAIDYINQKIIIDLARYNLTTTRRFSPGYGNWKIEQQKQLLKVIPAEYINLTITDTYQLIPRKSVLAVLGVLNSINNEQDYSCDVCKHNNCKYKKS